MKSEEQVKAEIDRLTKRESVRKPIEDPKLENIICHVAVGEIVMLRWVLKDED